MFSRAAVRSLRSSGGGTIAGRAGRRLVAPAIQHPKAALFLSTTKTMIRSFSTNPQEMTPPPTDMFCRQCEQTQNNVGCTTTGVCGKTSETAAVQDTLIEQVKAVSVWAVAARQAGISVPEDINAWTLQAAFSTLTNVNFSPDRICEYIRQGVQHQQTLQGLVGTTKAIPEASLVAASLDLSAMSDTELETFGQTVGILNRQDQMGNPDCFSLNEIGTYGLKGMHQVHACLPACPQAKTPSPTSQHCSPVLKAPVRTPPIVTT